MLEALDDAIPLYPVYPILFADHGLSTARISVLYILWSTITSVADVGADIAAIILFAVCGLLSQRLSVVPLIAWFGVPMMLLALASIRWLSLRT